MTIIHKNVNLHAVSSVYYNYWSAVIKSRNLIREVKNRKKNEHICNETTSMLVGKLNGRILKYDRGMI